MCRNESKILPASNHIFLTLHTLGGPIKFDTRKNSIETAPIDTFARTYMDRWSINKTGDLHSAAWSEMVIPSPNTTQDALTTAYKEKRMLIYFTASELKRIDHSEHLGRNTRTCMYTRHNGATILGFRN